MRGEGGGEGRGGEGGGEGRGGEGRGGGKQSDSKLRVTKCIWV